MLLKEKYARIKKWTKQQILTKIEDGVFDFDDLNICMYWSVFQSWYDVFQVCIHNGADINYYDPELILNGKNGDNILTYLCRKLIKRQNPNIIFEWIPLMINLGVNINHTDKKGKTALIIASEKQCYDGVMILAKKGCDPDIIDRNGYKAFDVYRRLKYLDYEPAMKIYMALNCSRDKWLLLLLEKKDWAAAKVELEFGPPKEPDELIWKAVGDWDCFYKLVEYGADLTQTMNGQTLLDYTLRMVTHCYSKYFQYLETALEIMRRRLIPIVPERLFYPFIEICKRNHEQNEYSFFLNEIALEFMHFGAHPSANPSDNVIYYGERKIMNTCCAPIYYACKHKNNRLIRLLLIHGATVDYDILNDNYQSFFEPYRELIAKVQQTVIWNDWEFNLWPKQTQEMVISTLLLAKKRGDMMHLPLELLFMIIKKAV